MGALTLPMMQRQPGWEQRLRALVDTRRSTPFAWGAQDCCSFALDALAACRGHRPALPGWRTERGAVRVLRRLGGMAGAADALAGPRIAPALAQRGDVVLVSQPGLFGTALAVCMGPVAYAAGAEGLVRVPRALWQQAWRI